MADSLEVYYSDRGVRLIANPDVPLTELSFGLESAFNWFIGHGCNAVEIFRGPQAMDGARRQFSPGGGQIVTVKPLAKVSPLVLSQCTLICEAINEKLFPLDLATIWKIQDGEAQPGGNGHRVTQSRAESIIETGDVLPDISIALLTFSEADKIVGFFARGVKHLKVQWSRRLCQVWFRHGLTDQEIEYYLSQQGVEQIYQNKKAGELR